ncbi:MAG: enoyl-CoA hydratase/isomerase family protein [Calditrichaeota bacterium]|nr:enoyl-CoA hydratase/isomerase family protein [Calditrichota bacterium]HQU73622.1 enoyl-CoA hydratase/isomerase family protein [Calditrichia bacterium]
MKASDNRLAGHVKSHVENGIAVIEFFHPSHNSLPGRLLAELREAITAAGKNPEVAVIVLQSGGERTFCAGASFEELISIEDEDSGRRFFMGFAGVINACRKCPRLIIGRVQGKAVGGGVGIASAVDYCIATQNAAVKLSELVVGIGPFVVGPAVQRKIGAAAFAQLSINASQFQSAQWAKEKGLYYEVHETLEAVDQAVMALATNLVNSNPEAQRLLKANLWEGTGHWDELLEERAAISGRLVLSEYTKKTLARFAQQQ